MESFKCRVCGTGGGYSTILKTKMPLAADVQECPACGLTRYPLHVVRCNVCGHVQLRETLEASFYGDYLYTPSFAGGFAAYIEKFVNGLDSRIDRPGRKVLEVGSSNGCLLKKFQEKGWDVLGVEPSLCLCLEAEETGVRTYNGFFSKDTAEEIETLMKNPDVLIFRHVMEHLDRLDEIAEAVSGILEDGLLLIEVPYLKKIICEDQFYAFFHEHLSYFSVTALYRLLSGAGIYIHRIYENTLEGGSFLAAADRKRDRWVHENIDDYLEDEKTALSAAEISRFAKRIRASAERIKKLVSETKDGGGKTAAWGAGQRGCTLISFCGFSSSELEYVIDVNKNYWWKYIPGTDIQIVPPDYYKSNHADQIIIFATGYADSIEKENADYTDAGGKFVRII